jgi:hypothetical protein
MVIYSPAARSHVLAILQPGNSGYDRHWGLQRVSWLRRVEGSGGSV